MLICMVMFCDFKDFEKSGLGKMRRSIRISKLQCAVLLCLGCPPILYLDKTTNDSYKYTSSSSTSQMNSNTLVQIFILKYHIYL